MSRRRKSRWPTAWLPWQDEMHEWFFPSLTKDWTPPAKVRVFHGRRHYTVVARFSAEEGRTFTCTTRFARASS